MFIFSTPIDSPADPTSLRTGNYHAQQQHQFLTGSVPANTSLHCNTANTSNGHQNNGWGGYPAPGQGMFSTNQSLPDSPPITDISGNGSSGSPSTNSEPPYSPDQYPYAGMKKNLIQKIVIFFSTSSKSQYDFAKYAWYSFANTFAFRASTYAGKRWKHNFSPISTFAPI